MKTVNYKFDINQEVFWKQFTLDENSKLKYITSSGTVSDVDIHITKFEDEIYEHVKYTVNSKEDGFIIKQEYELYSTEEDVLKVINKIHPF